MRNKPKLIVILGPTASGKTSLAIKLAKKYNGEIISADSRQVFRGMDIGSGKASKTEQRQAKHYLLDVADPQREFNVSHFKRQALLVIKKIYNKNKLPILTGGTGFWIQSVVDDLDLPKVKPDKKLRHQLSKKTTSQLYNILKKLDPRRAKSIDKKNPYRLIRAIEIIKATGKLIAPLKKQSPFDPLIIGISLPRKKLNKLIDQRLKKRISQGMITEVKKLHQQGVSWKRLYDIGLEYRYVSLYLRGILTRLQMVAQLENAIHKYAKRQMTWFKRDQRIHWINKISKAEQIIKKFYNK
ncbi:MAG: tRNA (adenosine(37)-N6)-dimethylallyltransferase MiaA [Patescibacteria group bacterium]|jgi:tRNA dimethylallyltransferase